MENIEYTERDSQFGEDATMLDRDSGATVPGQDYVTLQSSTEGTDADQPTLYASNTPSEIVENETLRDVPAPKIVTKAPSIKRLFTGEEVLISKPKFRIGRKEDNDYSVTHNPLISRKHAEITYRKGRYYIRDHGAKNRIFVNGVLLPAKGETELSNGDVIRLANEDFLIQL